MIIIKKLYFLSILILVFFFACGKKTDQSEINIKTSNEWFKYISANTSGSISKKSSIRILFVNPVSNKSINIENVFKFNPHIKGKTKWKSNRELIFVPVKLLPSDTKYSAVLNLDNVLDIPNRIKNYHFKFTVIKTEFEIIINGLSAKETPSPTIQKLKGKLTSSDKEEIESIKKIISATQDKKQLAISWSHGLGGIIHYFTIENIHRKDKQSEIILRWNGEFIGSKKKGMRQIVVPAIGQFKVSKIQAIQAEQQFIQIRFTDSLKKNQNLNGLIRISGQRLRFTINENLVKVYSNTTLRGQISISIERGIQNIMNRRLTKSGSHTITFQTINPAVRFVGKGNILPANTSLRVPFEAVNLHSVQVTAFQVYPGNMGQFLQTNSFKGKEQLERVGRHIWRKTIKLSNNPELTSKWNRYSLDVSSLFKKNPGSLFRLILSFNRGNSTYRCDDNSKTPAKEADFINSEQLDQSDTSSWDNSEDYEDEDDDWSNRNDPCYDAYYNPEYNSDKVRDERNFIASNTGIIAKMGENNLLSIVTTDIRTSEIVSSANIEVFNFQGRLIGKGFSNRSGMASIKLSSTPYLIKVKSGQDTSYLKINSESSLPLSHFDISGQKIRKGLKGHIYGERGVWRPGDILYLTFVLEDKNNTLPPNHPVSMEIYNPNGQLIQTINPYLSLKPFYTFKVKTDDSAITGNWKARVLLGGLTFDKSLKIETVVPNRLKVLLDFGEEELYLNKMPIDAEIFSQWLHGADASNLKAEVKVRYSRKKTRFSRFTDFLFDDPVRQFSGGEQQLFDGQLDNKGRANFSMELDIDRESPGMLNAIFESRVFEEGGGFSVDRIAVPFHPFSHYVGIKPPKGDIARGMLLTDVDQWVNIASIDAKGNPVSRKKIQVFLYKINWKWWWDKSGESLAQYSSSTHTSIIQKGEISTKNGLGKWKFKVKYPDWGRYLLRAYDHESGHITGKIIYIDWPGWAGRAKEEKGVGATRLTLTSDKKIYNAGETATIFLPETTQGRALISLETGSKVLEQRWVISRKNKNKFQIKITNKMAPNFFIHATLIQPHKDKKNDSPIRMYGIIPITVNDPSTHLSPKLKLDDILHPKENIEIKVSEDKGRTMKYTLAIVDEGLLGLTRFKTPNLHKEFYKKEALGVNTWDLFDDVVGAYGGELERILALGGDEAEDEKDREKKKRFPPIVIFKGPFSLNAGQIKSHNIVLPQYIGAVRVMLIAGEKGAYGFAEKSVPVKQDLILLSSLPRTTRPEENIEVPISVFVMNPDMKTIELIIKTDGLFEIMGNNKLTVQFDKPGDKMAFFKLRVKNRTGKGKIIIKASSRGFNTEEVTHMSVLNPNPATVRIIKTVIEPGKTWKQRIVPFGIENAHKALLEVSVLPPLNLQKRFSYLIQFPHGCLEQTVSKSFAQLYIPLLSSLSPKQKKTIENNINAAIAKIKTFQTSSGGFAYWPSGNDKVDNWTTNYAIHFLLKTKELGYHIPANVYSKMLDYQTISANGWTTGSFRSRLIQAYRLYTLALAKQADLGAMNRLRESDSLGSTAQLQLAAAFNLAGQRGAAEDLVKNADLKIETYKEHSNTYGSTIRDSALSLKLLTEMGKNYMADKIANELSNTLASAKQLNTQETAFALMAMAEYYKLTNNTIDNKFKLSLNDTNPELLFLKKPIFKKNIDKYSYPDGTNISIENPNSKKLYIIVYNEGVPKAGNEIETAEKLNLKIDYYDTDDSFINIDKLNQGQDIVAEITVSNPTSVNYENIALSYFFASGWQLHNPRFDSEDFSNSNLDYQDIRDDKVFSYFNLDSKTSKTFRLLLNASYRGMFYLPAVRLEAMYDSSIRAVKKGKWVEVIKE